ncbi:MAG: hypothetical protein IT180_12900 [Acidobacteria bacterium]|nr:hypothetical protein [Acidobacteriota bacterium]HQZ39021.1 hypothetical protein [Vicinamibacterales bacterium]
MNRREESDTRMDAALEAYRAAAWAEADAHFDERALEAQRARILQRLDQAGQRARVLPFPGHPAAGARPGAASSRRWISLAAAAGLLIGLVTGQLLHVVPGGSTGQRQAVRSQPAPEGPASMGVTRVSVSMTDPDDDLLDAIDLAVTRDSVSELRALHDLTFVYEPY